MYIIVVGGGNVGYGLALELQALADHEVAIVERSSSRARVLREELGAMVVHGDGSEIAFLEGVGASRADMFIAVTADDGANLIASQVAKHWFNVERVIARINDPRNEPLFHALGVDSTVSAARAVMAQIEATLPEHTVIPLLQLEGTELNVIDMRVQEGSPMAGRPLGEVSLPVGALIAIVIGAQGARVPDQDTVLQPGDEIIAVIPEGAEDAMRDLITGPPVEDIF